MKRFFTLLAILALTSSCYAGDSRYYNARGDYVGRSSPNAANPSQQNVYTKDGKYAGRVVTDPNNPGNSRVYDNHGNYLGRVSGPTYDKKK